MAPPPTSTMHMPMSRRHLFEANSFGYRMSRAPVGEKVPFSPVGEKVPFSRRMMPRPEIEGRLLPICSTSIECRLSVVERIAEWAALRIARASASAACGPSAFMRMAAARYESWPSHTVGRLGWEGAGRRVSPAVVGFLARAGRPSLTA